MANWRRFCPGVEDFSTDEDCNLLLRTVYAQYISNNTRKNMLSSLLVFYRNKQADHPLLDRLAKAYSLYEQTADAIHQSEQNNFVVDSLEMVRDKIRGKFPYGSKPSILTQIYLFWPMRDNCQLLIDGHIQPGYEGNVLKLTAPCLRILVRKSKCLHQPVERELSLSLSEEIMQYIHNNRLKQCQFLFGNKRLNKCISRYFQHCGVDGGINYLRKVHRASALKTKDHIQILNTAHYSFHKVKTARHYDTKPLNDE